jgi:hypothetical protein
MVSFLYLELLRRKMMKLEEDVILLWSTAPSLPDLHGHAAGHNVPGGQVLQHSYFLTFSN